MDNIQKSLRSLKQILTPGDIIHISLRMLGSINQGITMHSIRTAFLAWKITQTHQMNNKCTVQNLVMLALYHTLGYFREDFNFEYHPQNHIVDYFSEGKATDSKYIFACYYLKFMTPLGEDAVSLENFNQPYNDDIKRFIYQEDYKSIIYICARISDYVEKNPDKDLPEDINELAPGFFDPEYVEAFKIANKDNCLIKKLHEKNFSEELSEYISTIKFTENDSEQFEKILIYFLDFKSTYTVSHIINTTCYAISLGIRLNLSSNELSELFLSAVLHDIGKIATPQSILEFPGKLSPEQMGIMRHHVNHSKRIINEYAPENIVENVYRHHEKLNGKGYPSKVPGDNISLIQRILTVADITSALNDSRSYKKEFSNEKTISIITEMTDNGELDSKITKFIFDDFPKICEEQKYLHEVLKVEFSHVLNNYNNYLFDNTDMLADIAISTPSLESGLEELIDDTEIIEDIVAIDDLEEL